MEPAKPKTSDPLVGKLFGGCRVEKLIGKGGMGAVYLATQLNLDRPVAIKVIAPDILDDDESLQRLSREAKIVANLSHPNIVQLHFTGKEFNFPYLVMEYVDGQSLGVLLRQSGKISVPSACDVVLQVGFALEAAAAVGVVHRDIKPDNILITPDGRVKVTDFGLARRSDDAARLTLTGQSLGTPHYMSPEQCEGNAMDIRSDIYSLGITFWQCLAGFLPFDGETPFAILMKQVHEKLPDIRVVSPDVPKEVAEIIASMTAKDLATRMAEPGEIVRGLKKYLAGPEVKREKLKAQSRNLTGGSMTDVSGVFSSDPGGIGAQSSQAYRETNLGLKAVEMAESAVKAATPPKPQGEGGSKPQGEGGSAPVPPPPPPPKADKLIGRRRVLIAAAAGAAVAASGVAGLLLTRRKEKPPPTMKFALLRKIIGHTNAVKTLHFSPNGEWIASGGADKTVRVWKEVNGLQVVSLTGHAKMVTAVQFSPDLDVLATGGLDWTVRLWDTKDWRELRKLGPPSHTNTVTSLAFSADGETLASGSMDWSVMLWDWRKGSLRRTFKGHTGMVTCLEFRSDNVVLASGGADRRVNLWTLENPREFETCYPQSAMMTALAYSPDGQVLATAGQDSEIHLLNASTRAVMRTLEGHEKSVLSLAYSADSKWLASGGTDGTIRLWDVDKGVEAAMVEVESMVWALRFNPNRLQLAAGTQDGEILYYGFEKATE